MVSRRQGLAARLYAALQCGCLPAVPCCAAPSRAWDEPACNLSLRLILCCISHFALLAVVAVVVGLLSLAMLAAQTPHRASCILIQLQLLLPSLDWLSVGLSVVGFWLPSLAFVVIAMFLTNSQGNAHGCLFIVPCMRFTFIFNLCRQLFSPSLLHCCTRHPDAPESIPL